MTVRRVRVGDVLRLERTKLTPNLTEMYRQIGIYSWGKGVIENEPLSGVELSKVTYYRFPAHALLLSNIQAWEAAIAVSDEHHAREFIASQRFLPYMPKREGEVSTGYLLQFFLSDHGMALIRKASPGTVTRNRTLGIKAFENLVIPLPPIGQQRAIAARLDRMASLPACLSMSGGQRRRRTDVLRQGVVDSGASGGWPVELGTLLCLERRSVQVNPEAEYREIGVRAFGKGLFRKPPVSGAELGDKRVFFVREGDLVVSNVFAWEGAIAVASKAEDGRIGSHRFMTWVPVSDEVDIRYLFRYLTSEHGVAKLLKASPGSAGRNKTLAIESFKRITVPLPAIEVQRDVAARLDRWDDLDALIARQRQVADALPQAARNEVFSKLV
ncbi:hypothetical protein DQ238_09135 [Geodermatophilus sp. TF02-6]|uniref:restriction endonuclease subunit S n=1 Tax=Geodermatophilus sp. TF02-6 TaxID=2250575 RepID=UPI000DE8C466|nr:restriction endonuclease subunit S [Geodermatophilus sp. TF02-6]RBY79800.1 hypothetical protein DQ238_09135 [Geodermatophilus sp. TF02-6]